LGLCAFGEKKFMSKLQYFVNFSGNEAMILKVEIVRVVSKYQYFRQILHQFVVLM